MQPERKKMGPKPKTPNNTLLRIQTTLIRAFTSVGNLR